MSGLRRTGAALRHKNFALFWYSGLISNTGRWFQSVAVPVVVYDLTGSVGWVGLAGFAQIFPMALMGPIAGVLGDRYARRRLLFVTQMLQALAAGGLMVLWFAGVRSVEAYIAMSFVAGLMSGLNLPSWQAFVSELVPRELLLSAITLNSAQFNASRLLGPALAGVMIGAVGPGWAFMVNMFSFIAVLVALALMRLPNVHVPPTERMRPIKEFIGAIGYARARPGIRTAILAVALIGFFGLSLQTLAIVMAEEVFDRGESGFGLMLSSLGAGAVLVPPLVAVMSDRLRRSQIQEFALVLYGVGIVVLATAPVFIVSLAGLFLMGAAHLTSASTLNTAIQLQVDEAVRTKVLSVYITALVLANPVGQLVLGQAIERIGPRETIGAAGVVLIVVVLWLRLRGHLRGLDQEVGSYEPAAVAEVHPSTPAPPKGYQPSPSPVSSPSDK